MNEKTVFQPRASDAEDRLRAIASGQQSEDHSTDDNEEPETSSNLEEDANNRIREYIDTHFHGHGFTRLVAAVLQAQEYAVDNCSARARWGR